MLDTVSRAIGVVSLGQSLFDFGLLGPVGFWDYQNKAEGGGVALEKDMSVPALPFPDTENVQMSSHG
jgi:hypothetical protein